MGHDLPNESVPPDDRGGKHSADDDSPPTLLAPALDYYARGWSIIPMRMDEKKIPAVRWTRYQTTRADARRLRRWFGRRRYCGLAVIFGVVSGNLGSRDFDDMAAYDAWAAAHPELAAILPTVATARGRHVYFRTDPADVARLRVALGKPDGKGAINLGDGELRIGTGCYSVLPPSQHPSGFVYCWLIPFGDEVPLVADLESAGFYPPIRRRACHPTQRTQDTIAPVVSGNGIPLPTPHCLEFSVSSVSREVAERIELAIARTLPTRKKQRHDLVFTLARELKAIGELCDKPATVLRPIVWRWHECAKPYLTKGFTETWTDFAEGWDKVKHPAGKGPLRERMAAATREPLPAAAQQYPEPKVKLLVGLCQELQRHAGTAPFYLTVRAVGELFGVHHGTAARWLKALRIDGVLRLARAHAPMRAAEYFFVSSKAKALDQPTDIV